MKRLKLQKALLAICLALPITLTTSNGINAMQSIDLQKEQKSNDKGPNETTNTTDQFPRQIKDYIKGHDITTPLTEKDYIKFLQGYIKDDPEQYISLLIKATYYQLQKPNGKYKEKN